MRNGSMMVFTEADYRTAPSESEDSTRRRGEAEKIEGAAARFLACLARSDWLPYKLPSYERDRAPGSGGLHEMHALPRENEETSGAFSCWPQEVSSVIRSSARLGMRPMR